MNEYLKGMLAIDKDYERDEAVIENAENKNILKCDVEMIRTVLKALHMYHAEAYHENEQSTANEILDVIRKIKETSKWDHEDDKHIGQIDNPINKPFTKCIDGSNCE